MTVVGVVGLGLMGGSFAKALHKGNEQVFAWNRNRETLLLAKADSVDEELTLDNIPQCDLIILTTYPEHCIEWLREHAPFIKSETIVIDVAGIKRKICEECWSIAGEHNFTFVGCHPMAGTQYSGYAHATSDMFEGAPMIVVTHPQLSDLERVKVVDKIQNYLSPCKFGFYTQTTAENHDRIIAYTSQLAHVISSAYANNKIALERNGFSAGSWKDLTRVAWLNPEMWAELFLENADNLMVVLDKTIDNLNRFKSAIMCKDKQDLIDILAEGAKIKHLAENADKE